MWWLLSYASQKTSSQKAKIPTNKSKTLWNNWVFPSQVGAWWIPAQCYTHSPLCLFNFQQSCTQGFRRLFVYYTHVLNIIKILVQEKIDIPGFIYHKRVYEIVRCKCCIVFILKKQGIAWFLKVQTGNLFETPPAFRGLFNQNVIICRFPSSLEDTKLLVAMFSLGDWIPPGADEEM